MTSAAPKGATGRFRFDDAMKSFAPLLLPLRLPSPRHWRRSRRPLAQQLAGGAAEHAGRLMIVHFWGVTWVRVWQSCPAGES
jgi:hypothetical protein